MNRSLAIVLTMLGVNALSACATPGEAPEDPYACLPPPPACVARCDREYAERPRPDAWEYQSCLRGCQTAADGGKCY